MELDQLKDHLIETGRYLRENALAWGTSGNMSARIDAERMLITASGTRMADLDRDDFAVCAIASGASTGKRKASKEVPMHAGIYQARADAQVVLHSSPFYATLAACSDLEPLDGLFIESMYYLERVAYAPYHHPGSQGLGDAVREAAAGAQVIFLMNHGVILFDDGFKDAVMRLETLELNLRMVVEARAAGLQPQELPAATVRDFLEHAHYKPRKLPPGAESRQAD